MRQPDARAAESELRHHALLQSRSPLCCEFGVVRRPVGWTWSKNACRSRRNSRRESPAGTESSAPAILFVLSARDFWIRSEGT